MFSDTVCKARVLKMKHVSLTACLHISYFHSPVGQLAVYDQIKSAIRSFGVDADAKRNQIGASVLAGAVTSLITNPIDVIKTRLMFQQKAAPSAVSNSAAAAPASPVRYRGTIHCFQSTVQSEGWRALFKGLLPNFSR
jgi:hypothetical protein